MDSRKRKREDEIPGPSKKIIRNYLSKRYNQRVRDIPEVLMNGANLNVGHVVGTLEAIGRDGDALTFEIKDDRDKILVCQFAAPHLRLDNNRAIEKPIELAIKAACRYPLDNPGNNRYSFKLLFDQFQFVLGGQLYMNETGWVDDSDDEEDTAPVPTQKQVPHTTRSAPVVQATNVVPANDAAASTSRAQKTGWTTLFDALKNHPRNDLTVAGIVKEVPYPPKQMGGKGDWSMTVHLIDSTTTERQFLEVKLYAKYKAHLPPLDEKFPKDVALLVSGVQIQVKHGRYVFASGNTCRYVCFAHGDTDPHVRDIFDESADIFKSAPVYRWTDAELVDLKHLMAWYRGEQILPSFQEPSGPRESSNDKGKHKLIEELKLDDHFDCTVELLNKYSGKNSNIYVTDFTVNELLRDPKSTKFSFPPGHRTLLIQLYDYPAEQVGSLEVGYIYRIKHVRLRGKDGFVKGHCGSFKNGGKNEIEMVETGDEHLENLKARKRAYETGGNELYEPKSRPTETLRTAATKPPQSKNEQAEKPERVSTDSSKPVSPSSPSSPRTEVPETLKGVARPPKSTSPPPVPKPKIIKTYPEFPDLLLIESSNLIQCKYPAKYPLNTLEEIKFSQVNPALFKFRGRIVDVEPGNLEESVIRFCTACKDACDGAICASCRIKDTVEYRPRIQITFQDATGEFPVKFGDAAAVKFFRLSKKARHNKEILLKELSKRFQTLLGPSSGSKYQVGGVSEILELVVRSWQIKVEVARPQGPGAMRWVKCFAPAGCWVAAEEQI